MRGELIMFIQSVGTTIGRPAVKRYIQLRGRAMLAPTI